jgi:hypothetical protein
VLENLLADVVHELQLGALRLLFRRYARAIAQEEPHTPSHKCGKPRRKQKILVQDGFRLSQRVQVIRCGDVDAQRADDSASAVAQRDIPAQESTPAVGSPIAYLRRSCVYHLMHAVGCFGILVADVGLVLDSVVVVVARGRGVQHEVDFAVFAREGVDELDFRVGRLDFGERLDGALILFGRLLAWAEGFMQFGVYGGRGGERGVEQHLVELALDRIACVQVASIRGQCAHDERQQPRA